MISHDCITCSPFVSSSSYRMSLPFDEPSQFTQPHLTHLLAPAPVVAHLFTPAHSPGAPADLMSVAHLFAFSLSRLSSVKNCGCSFPAGLVSSCRRSFRYQSICAAFADERAPFPRGQASFRRPNSAACLSSGSAEHKRGGTSVTGEQTRTWTDASRHYCATSVTVTGRGAH